jgi:uncharacterized membrane protein
MKLNARIVNDWPTLSGLQKRLQRLQRLRPLRVVVARPRLLISTVVGILVGVFLTERVASQFVTRILIAWNTGSILYIILAATMMVRSSNRHMRRRALLQDEGKLIILFLVIAAGVASLVAIAAELAVVKDMHGVMKAAHVTLAGITVVSSWAFIQIMFAQHYAHDYYGALCEGKLPGLQFPEEDHPDYGDFFYAAAIIGTSGQTADVAFTTKPMRRLGSLHCILAYLFNTTVLALLVNIGASLF